MKDFFEILEKDHNEVSEILAQLQDTSEGAVKTRQKMFNQLKEAFIPHLKAEESAFYSLLVEQKDGKKKALEAIEEHRAAETIFGELENLSVQDPTWSAKLKVFAELVEHHIEEEEEEIFEIAHDLLAKEEFETIRQEFEKEKRRVKEAIACVGCTYEIPGRRIPSPRPSGKYKKSALSDFNPLQEKGMPLDQQTRSWNDLTAIQYDKHEVHPYTRTRIITMNGIEVAAAIFKHMMARMTPHPEIKNALAVSRRIEQQQQKAVSGMIPGNESILENTVGYEQVAVDLTAWCARNEPDAYMRQAYEFALLEDFDHLYRYANMLDMESGALAPEQIVGKLTEIMPGRPTIAEHRHPLDSIRKPMDITTAAPITLMNVMSLVASEQQTMNFYMNVANRPESALLRGLYTEIAMIEEQHVSHYESLMDPRCSWLMCMVMHELHECYLYHAFMQQEVDPRVKKLWEIHLAMELGHLQYAVDLYKKHEGEDPAQFLPPGLPAPLTFESNIDYIRQVLEEQVELTADGHKFTPVDKLSRDHRYFDYQSMVNAGMVPSHEVIKEHIRSKKKDYRFTTAPHPIARFKDQTDVPER